MKNLSRIIDEIAERDKYSRYNDWYDERFEIDEAYGEFGWDDVDGYVDYDFDEEEFSTRDDGSSPLAYL